MDLRSYLDQTGYTKRLSELTDMMSQRDRFALMVEGAPAASRTKARKTLTELDAAIALSVDTLGDEYEEAIKYMNLNYIRENGPAILNDLIPRVIGEPDKPNAPAAA